MGKLIHLPGALLLLLSASAPAQSISAPIVPGKADKSAVVKTDKPGPNAAEAPQVTDLPSRYAGPDAGNYIQALLSMFSIQSRATDPFGQPQDLNARVKKATITRSPVARPVAIPVAPFNQIVAQIRVNLIMANESRFLVGTRSFAVGDRFPLSFNGRNYPSQVIEVTKERIVLRNVDTSELGEIRQEVLPAGMSPAGKGADVPAGMQVARPDSPLIIEPDTPTPTTRGVPLPAASYPTTTEYPAPAAPPPGTK